MYNLQVHHMASKRRKSLSLHAPHQPSEHRQHPHIRHPSPFRGRVDAIILHLPPRESKNARLRACVRSPIFPFSFWPRPAARRMPLANDLLLHAEDERQMSARRTAAGKQLKWKASRMLSLTTPPPPPSLARLGRLAQRGSAVGGPQTRQLIPNDYTDCCFGRTEI